MPVIPTYTFVHTVDLPIPRIFQNILPLVQKNLIKEKICSNWIPHSFSEERTIDEAIETYNLASYSATLKKEKHITLQAFICVSLGYIDRNKIRTRNTFYEISSS